MDTNPVNFTGQAIDALQRLRQVLKVPPGTGVRIGTRKAGGCDTPDFVIGFDEMRAGDLEYEIGDMKILMHKTDSLHLLGLTVDYAVQQDAEGFIFRQ